MSERPKASRWRKTGIVVLLFFGWLLVTLGVVGVYLQRSLYNSDAFASRVSAVISAVSYTHLTLPTKRIV